MILHNHLSFINHAHCQFILYTSFSLKFASHRFNQFLIFDIRQIHLSGFIWKVPP